MIEGIARVEDLVVEIEHPLAVELVGAGLGEDLNAAEADAVVFSRERIAVDADFADG
jgi:hypothetical protein